MKLLLKRKFKGETCTIGDLYIDGVFFCNTLEDKVRILPPLCSDTPKGINCRCKEKVYARTAIPCGTYKITMAHSPRFKRVLPYLHDVPHFLGILIHSGTTVSVSAMAYCFYEKMKAIFHFTFLYSICPVVVPLAFPSFLMNLLIERLCRVYP